MKYVSYTLVGFFICSAAVVIVTTICDTVIRNVQLTYEE